MAKQPQEKTLGASLIETRQLQDQELLQSGNELPAKLIAIAEQKLVGYHELKSDVDGRLQHVHDNLALIRQILRDHAYDKKTEAGYLMQDQTAYLACLELKHVELEDLLRKDELFWVKHVETVRRNAEDVKSKIQALFEKQNAELAALLAQQMRIAPPSRSYNLRKVPFWGKAADHELNFEWPTQEQFDQMPEDVRLQSLEFRYPTKPGIIGIAAVKVTLSHGFKSELFQLNGPGRSAQTVNFDQSVKIKKIAGADNNAQYDGIFGVKFMSQDDKQVSVYDPERDMKTYPGAVHTLGDNEELIGVYGKKGGSRFSAFGFITKIADEE